MKIVSGVLFFCIAVSVVDRCAAQGEECECALYYQCDASNVVSRYDRVGLTTCPGEDKVGAAALI